MLLAAGHAATYALCHAAESVSEQFMRGDPEPTRCRYAFIRPHEFRRRDRLVDAHLHDPIPIEQKEILVIFRDFRIEKNQTRIAV